MARKVGVEGLAAALEQIFDKYGEEVMQHTEEITKATATKGLKALKESTEAAGIGHGKYAVGWEKTQVDSGIVTTIVLHNARPGLPHLIENPHMLRNGKRSTGKSHIKPVEDMINEYFEKELRAKL